MSVAQEVITCENEHHRRSKSRSWKMLDLFPSLPGCR